MLTDTIRKMASIQRISSLEPIENSDFLEVAMMKDLGWKVVVKKGEFKVGDTVIYFEIDSAINVKDLVKPLEFLKDKGTKKLFTGRTADTSTFSEEYVRIKTIKLRGQVSQGLIIPIPNGMLDVPNDPAEMNRDWEGEDFTAVFHVEVWDRLVEWFADRSQLGTRAQFHRGSDFPSDVPKTDEIRVQSVYFNLIKDPANTEGVWEVTEKNDGSSSTLFYRPLTWKDKKAGPMQISSRRFMIKDDGSSDDWLEVFKRMGGFKPEGEWDQLRSMLQNVYDNGIPKNEKEYLLPPGHELAIQGEMIGPRFNGNRDKNKENHFRVFRIFDITDQKFVTPEVRYRICEAVGLEHVKVIETCQIFKKLKSVDEFLAYAEGKTDNGLPREGVVFKRVDDGSVSFKAVSNSYLLHEQ